MFKKKVLMMSNMANKILFFNTAVFVKLTLPRILERKKRKKKSLVVGSH
jgi:hypothetical protein